MAKIIPIILTFLLLSGCATIHDTFWKHDMEQVNVPVIVAPPAPPKDAFETPQLLIDTIKDNDEDGVVVKKYIESIIILKSYVKKLQVYLGVYRKD